MLGVSKIMLKLGKSLEMLGIAQLSFVVACYPCKPLASHFSKLVRVWSPTFTEQVNFVGKVLGVRRPDIHSDMLQ